MRQLEAGSCAFVAWVLIKHRNFLLFRPTGCIVFSTKETFVFQKILSLGIRCRSVVNMCQSEAVCLSEPLVCRCVRCHIQEDRISLIFAVRTSDLVYATNSVACSAHVGNFMCVTW